MGSFNCVALCWAVSIASSEISSAKRVGSAKAFLSAKAMQPLPLQMSKIAAGLGSAQFLYAVITA